MGVGKAAVIVDGIARSFGDRPALRGINFEINHGEVVALLGPNGAGKTTAVRILTGVLAADSGRASVLGLDPATQGNEIRKIVGVMTEASGLDDRLTAFENIEVYGAIRGLPRVAMHKRIGELLEQFNLGDRATDLVGGFSTGQRKRVALARALLHEPQVLFLDEPTSGLDPEATRDVLDLIASLAKDHGRTVLYCTHFLHEAGRLCERMVVLRQGEVMAFGKPSDLAAELYRGGRVHITLGATATREALQMVDKLHETEAVEPTETGIAFLASVREVIPEVVRTLTDAGIAIYGISSPEPTMEDVYFALAAKAATK